jgi:hypothetical protein
MIWTKTKPTMPGYYWLKMEYEVTGQPFSNQPPRVVKVARCDDGFGWDGTELRVLEGPDFNENDGSDLCDMSPNFDWSSVQITLPSVLGSCNCHLYGNAACSSCDDTMPPPIKAGIDMDLPFSEFAERHLK